MIEAGGEAWCKDEESKREAFDVFDEFIAEVLLLSVDACHASRRGHSGHRAKPLSHSPVECVIRTIRTIARNENVQWRWHSSDALQKVSTFASVARSCTNLPPVLFLL